MRVTPAASIVSLALLISIGTLFAGTQTLNATFSNINGGHGDTPATAAISGPAQIKCTKATTDYYGSPNPRPAGCRIAAPGVNADIRVGQTVGASGAGTVILTCQGTGNQLTCSGTVTQ